MSDIETWIDNHLGDEWNWYIKRLSGNDTQLTGGHQAGPYIPKKLIFALFPTLESGNELNPRVEFNIVVDSHSAPEHAVKAIWYNNKIIENGTRNECRVTGWGGSDSPVLDPDATGSICVFCFNRPFGQENSEYCRVWLCQNIHEEDAVENVFGIVEPGIFITRFVDDQPAPDKKPCILDEESLPAEWIKTFPTGKDIVLKSIELSPRVNQHKPDKRLLARRDCEFEIFLSVERYWTLPQIANGFNTVNAFIKLANSVTNRRKARAGRSLEIQAKTIFLEEKLSQFSHDQISEGKKRPDFLFPSADAYRDLNFPVEKLRMLAAKTTCKDRWRQILSEASRVPIKHLLTLQEGVSLNQFNEMEKEGVVLVVPSSLHRSYPETIRPKLKTFESFIAETKSLYVL